MKIRSSVGNSVQTRKPSPTTKKKVAAKAPKAASKQTMDKKASPSPKAQASKKYYDAGKGQGSRPAQQSQNIDATNQRIDNIENRERTTIKYAEDARKETGWFGAFHRALTLSDPYQIEINNSKNTLGAMRTARGFLEDAERTNDPAQKIELLNQTRRLIGMREIDPRSGEISEQAPKTSGVNRTQTDRSHFELEQEAISVSRDVAITGAVTAGTLGGGLAAGAVGKGGQMATQSLMQTVKSGAVIGATETGMESAARNIDDVQRGEVTQGEALKNVVGDTTVGAVTGALGAGAGHKLASGVRTLSKKSDDAVSGVNRSLDDQITAKLELADRLEQSLPGGRFHTPDAPMRGHQMSGAGGMNNREIQKQVQNLREDASELTLRRNKQNSHQSNHGGQKGSKDLANVRHVARESGIPEKMHKKFGKYVERRNRTIHERPEAKGYDGLKELAQDFLSENGLMQ